jgi:hypothetical protein
MGQERTAQGTGTAPFFIGFYIFVTRKKVVLIEFLMFTLLTFFTVDSP